MGHQAAHLHDQPTGDQKQGSPGRVGAGTDQDLVGDQRGGVGIEDDAHSALDHAGRDGTAGQDPIGSRVAGRSDHALVKGLAVAQQEAGNLAAAGLAGLARPALPHQRRPVPLLPGSQGPQLGQAKEKEVIGPGQKAGLDQLAAAVQQRGADEAHGAHGPELGGLAQAGQGAHAAGSPADPAGLEPAARGGPDLVRQAVDGSLGSGGPASKGRVRRLVGILDLEVALQRLHDGHRVLAPAGTAQVDLAQAPHAIALQEAGDGGLGRLGEGGGQGFGGQGLGIAALEMGQGLRTGPDLDGHLPEGQVHLGGHVVGQAAGDGQGILLAAGDLAPKVQ